MTIRRPGSPETPGLAAGEALDIGRLLRGAETAKALLAAITRIFGEQVAQPSIEARTLVRTALGISQVDLLTQPERQVSSKARSTLIEMIARRLRHEPLQYITGVTEFYGREFAVDSRVLIPRPETELLIEQALLRLKEQGLSTPRVLDIGTGSDVLAVTMPCELPGSHVIATDISADAIEVAKRNAERHGASSQVELRNSSLAAEASGPFDIILSNPPYVRTGFLDGPEAQPELGYEPRMALDGGADGLAIYEKLLPELDRLLAANGAAYIEIDPPVARSCFKLARQRLPNDAVSVLTDLAGLERCLVIQRGES